MFLTSLFRAATPENPSYNLNSAQAVEDFLGSSAAKNSSGVKVDAECALAHSPWWRGISLISGDVGKLPLHIYRRDGDGKGRATEHPAYSLLRRKPNTVSTAYHFKRTLTAHALNHGNGYAYIYRQGDAAPVDLMVLSPCATTPVWEDRRLVYVTSVNGERRKLQAYEVLHIKGLGFDGLTGYSVWEKARETLGRALGAAKFASVFFKNNARPNIALTFPGNLADKEVKELRASWERLQGGLDNAHRVALLKGGMELKEFSINARDAQLLELRQFEIREVANFLGIPPHKLGDNSRTAYASLEQENLSYLGESLDPWLVAWEEECWDKLLTDQEKEEDSHFVEFLREALIRMSSADQAMVYRTALAGQPWMKVNEVRSKLNLDPVEGGDEIKEPLNMGKGGAVNEPNDPNGNQPGPQPNKAALATNDAVLRGAARQGLIEVAGRMVNRLGIQATKAAKKPAEFLAWLDAMVADNQGVVAEAAASPLGFAAAVAGPRRSPVDAASDLIEHIHDALQVVADTATAAVLAGAVSETMERIKTEWPSVWAANLLGE
jgi:HK97 family phage portal protein